MLHQLPCQRLRAFSDSNSSGSPLEPRSQHALSVPLAVSKFQQPERPASNQHISLGLVNESCCHYFFIKRGLVLYRIRKCNVQLSVSYYSCSQPKRENTIQRIYGTIKFDLRYRKSSGKQVRALSPTDFEPKSVGLNARTCPSSDYFLSSGRGNSG